MSYDVSLMIDTGDVDLCQIGDGWNYTYNCGPMFREALATVGIEGGINGLHGRVAGDVAAAILAAANDMALRAKHYATMDPENGWGDHRSAAKWLREIGEACAKHPKTTIDVS